MSNIFFVRSETAGKLAADFVADVADGLVVGKQGWLATGDLRKRVLAKNLLSGG
ncbi:MAG: hypothetical protein F6K35_43705 [Okeania sp. SIO2H7]|nr:hypothetical protein [Okeania sp. SIO2H7]